MAMTRAIALFSVMLALVLPCRATEVEKRAVSIPAWSGTTSGTIYVGVPGKPAPGILLLHTGGGLSGADESYGARLAAEGFQVLVARYRPTWSNETNAALLEALDWLAQSPEVGGLPVGIVGFSLGASKALILAGSRPSVRAVVAYYATYDGMMSKFAKMFRGPPVSPVDVADKINGAVLLLQALHDDETPPDQTEKMLSLLKGKVHEIVRYPNGLHMFEREQAFHPRNNVTNFGTHTEFNEDAARDSWQRSVAWFKKYLASP